MGPDRGMGGSMERSHPSTSNEGDSRQEQDVSRSSNTTTDEKKLETTGRLPRRQCLEAPSRTASPAMTAEPPSLSRQSSSMSSTLVSPIERSDPIKSPEPPVTKATLSELDVMKIVHNPKLRHD